MPTWTVCPLRVKKLCNCARQEETYKVLYTDTPDNKKFTDLPTCGFDDMTCVYEYKRSQSLWTSVQTQRISGNSFKLVDDWEVLFKVARVLNTSSAVGNLNRIYTQTIHGCTA